MTGSWGAVIRVTLSIAQHSTYQKGVNDDFQRPEDGTRQRGPSSSIESCWTTGAAVSTAEAKDSLLDWG